MTHAWCTGMPPLIPLLIVLSLLGYVSHNTLPSRVVLLLPQLVSTVMHYLCRPCMQQLREEMRHGCGAQNCPILCTCRPSFLSWVMSPRYVFPSRVMVPSLQPVSTVGQMAFCDNACEGCVTV